MPDLPPEKLTPHPWHGVQGDGEHAIARTPSGGFVDLVVASNLSFLRGASHPEEYVTEAKRLGAHAVAITDRHSVGGVVRAHVAARKYGVRLVPGTRIECWPDREAAERFEDWERSDVRRSPKGRLDLVLHAENPEGWGTICRLLTIGKRRAGKGRCRLTIHDLLDHHRHVMVTIMPFESVDQATLDGIEGLRRSTDLARRDALSIAVQSLEEAGDEHRLLIAANLSERFSIPLVAQNDVHMHDRSRRMVQDVLACIRHRCLLDSAGDRLHPNDERRLRSSTEMRRRFESMPEALDRTLEIAERCGNWSLDSLGYEYPSEVVPGGMDALSRLRELVEHGARERFGAGIPEAVLGQLDHEFELVDELGYAKYFLTVHDLVQFARRRGILCQGRGAAANSVICYCLGVTAVDPTRIDMLFERFISRERHEPPDIDIDFEHERREEVIQYVYDRYGRDRAALVAEIVTFRGRSAVREVGEAMGISRDLLDRLAGDIEWWTDGPIDRERSRSMGLDPESPILVRLFGVVETILGFPRHRSQHVGGFIISDRPLHSIVPIENAAMRDRTVVEWDKDDVDAMGMLKVDCLALGMLTCLRRAIDLANVDRDRCDDRSIQARTGPRRLDFHAIPAEDPEVYSMVSRADTIGVFQIESRAQMSMLPRMRPRCFYDLVIEVAIVRPGPIQGDMVHPYLKRREGIEEVRYPNDEVRRVLEKTLGVPLFQEQAMALAIVAAGFSAGEADALRRAIAAWKRNGNAIAMFGARLEEGMVGRGYSREFARQVFTQIQGFSGYGFPESHAASFALLVYASSWFKCREPAAFAAALINSQPMGFYAPAQIVRDVQQHGVEVRRIDVANSAWDCTLERSRMETWDLPPESGSARPSTRCGPARDQPAIRLGLRMVKGLEESEGRRLAGLMGEAQRRMPRTIGELRARTRISIGGLRRLAEADALRSLGLDRQRALWEIQRLKRESLPLFDGDCLDPATGERDDKSGIFEPPVSLPASETIDEILEDYASTGLSIHRHPMACWRPRLGRLGIRPAVDLEDPVAAPDGGSIAVAGVVLLRQRPGTAHGIVFITLEDETGTANLVVKPRVYRRYRTIVRHEAAFVATGRVERRGEVVHLVVGGIAVLPPELEASDARSGDLETRGEDP